MSIFSDSVKDFLESKGFHCKNETDSGIEVLRVSNARKNLERNIVLLGITAAAQEEAVLCSDRAKGLILNLKETEEHDPVVLTEDIWKRRPEMSQGRLLAHLETFFPIYARNCEVRRIDKATAAGFLADTHTYGDAVCRYRYGLFLKRHTGHIAALAADASAQQEVVGPSTLVAVATFSNARKWIKGDKSIRSYEWTRYASLPGLRVNGGMGKLLKAFIKEVSPDDIMSYADLEWSEGKVYENLGFTLEGHKAPVDFYIDPGTWERQMLRKQDGTQESAETACGQRLYFRNFGSAKYRLKLTEYE